MHVWRICKRAYARAPLTGEGGLRVSGRWHTAKRPVVYTSGSLALASLEALVHADPELAPSDLVAVEVEIPASVRVTQIDRDDLPRGWQRYPAPAALQGIGNEWLAAGRTAVLGVPSAIVPSERNYLVNPSHSDARRIRVIAKAAFVLDPRLLRGR